LADVESDGGTDESDDGGIQIHLLDAEEIG